MPRTKKHRCIEGEPQCCLFSPSLKMTKKSDIIELALDEYEAIRLSDKEGLSMQDAARQMGISAPTFCRVLQSAHHKIALALNEGKSIKICTMCSQ